MTDMTRPPPPEVTCDEGRGPGGAFVVGALGAGQADGVRAHVASCADPHADTAELGSVLSVLAESVPVVEPPAGLKDRILAAAAADLEERTRASAVGAPTDRGAQPGTPPVQVPPGMPATVPMPFPTAAERQQRA